MISQTTLSRNKAQAAVASHPNQHITGMLLLLLSVVVVGLLLTATSLNSAIGDNLGAFTVLVVVVVGAIVGFANMLKSAQGGS